MANSRIYLKSEAGGTTVVSRDTTATSGNLVLPAGGNIASVDTAVTDNAIARYDSTTGKLQNSGVVIDDSDNVGIGIGSPLTRLHITSNNSSLAPGQPQFIISGDANKERMSIRSSSGGAVITVGNCGGTIESPSSVTSGMFLGSYQFGGYAGSTSVWTRGAQIAGYASGNWTDTSFPADISFMTIPSGSTTLTERMRIDTNGNVLLTSGTGALGYGTGAGGTVTQLTSKSTAVTLNKPTGQIITSNSSLAAGATAGFILNNSLLTGNDNVKVIVGGAGAAGAYQADCTYCINGAANITIKNLDAVSRTDAVAINFTITKGATA